MHADLTDATFSPELVDFPALVAKRHYPAELVDGVDVNAVIRGAYARGYADALRATA